VSGRRVLVTGADGFIGRHALGPLADAGVEVHGVSRRPQPRGGPVTWHRADLLDPVAMAKVMAQVLPTDLLHLAWETTHGRFWTDPRNLDWTAASLQLLRAFAEGGGRRMVLAGTCAEYDWTLPGEAPWAENRPAAPATLYGAAKHTLHGLAAAFAREAGLALAWGRIFLVTGPGEAPARLVPSLADSLLLGEPARTGPGHKLRDLMDTRDAGAAFAHLVTSDLTGPVNVCTGIPVAIGQVARRLAELAGRPDLAAPGSLPDRAGDPAFMVGAADRLAADGFRPAFDLDRMLADALDRARAAAAQ
jgi:nucleoside-diphosphate-sugar epimerase